MDIASNPELVTVIAGLAAIGVFQSRAFLPAFAVAAMLKWGHHIPAIGDSAILQSIQNVPGWFTHDITVAVLGLLAATEITATKVPEAREVLNQVDQYIKTGMSALTYMGMAGVLDDADRELIEQLQSAAAPDQAGFFDMLPAMAVGGTTFFMAKMRNAAMGLLIEADPDDDARVQGLIAWAEDIWAFFGVFIFVLFPVLMLVLVALVLGTLWLIQKRAEAKEANAKIACPNCESMNWGCAPSCYSCRQPMPSPRAVGFFGTTLRKKPAPPGEAHTHRLAEKRRCPRCGDRLSSRQIHQSCDACGAVMFDRPDEGPDYLNRVGARVPMVLLVSAAFSLIPIVGLIPGIVYYRLALVAPLRRYLPLGKGMVAKIFLKIVFFLLIWLQVVPFVGVLAVPLMALLSYGLYRGLFTAELNKPREQLMTEGGSAPQPA